MINSANVDATISKRCDRLAVDMVGLPLATHVTPANQQECAHVKELAEAVQDVTQQSVEVAFVDQGYTSDKLGNKAQEAGSELVVVKLPEVRRGFMRLTRRWMVERSFARTVRFCRLARDFERLPETFQSPHFLAFAILILQTLKMVVMIGTLFLSAITFVF